MAWKLAFKGKMDKVPLKKLQKPALTAKSRTERKVENQTRSPSENAIISEAWDLSKSAPLSVHEKIWTFGNFLSAKCYDERMAWILQIWKYNIFLNKFWKIKNYHCFVRLLLKICIKVVKFYFKNNLYNCILEDFKWSLKIIKIF